MTLREERFGLAGTDARKFRGSIKLIPSLIYRVLAGLCNSGLGFTEFNNFHLQLHPNVAAPRR